MTDQITHINKQLGNTMAAIRDAISDRDGPQGLVRGPVKVPARLYSASELSGIAAHVKCLADLLESADNHRSTETLQIAKGVLVLVDKAVNDGHPGAVVNHGPFMPTHVQTTKGLYPAKEVKETTEAAEDLRKNAILLRSAVQKFESKYQETAQKIVTAAPSKGVVLPPPNQK